MKIDNMREEHNERVIMSNEKAVAKTAEEELKKMESAQDKPRKPEGFICASAGTGLSEIFTELGVDVIIEGGQTMNLKKMVLSVFRSEMDLRICSMNLVWMK